MSKWDSANAETVNAHYRQSLTVWGDTCSAQMREGAFAVHHYDGALQSTENGEPYMLPVADAVLLRDVLNAATERGFLPSSPTTQDSP